MWLLNTQTLKLEAFLSRIPEYAILSHRWEETEELSFGDVTAEYQHLKGYQKVVTFCEEATRHGFQYAWVDTCCIDKKSSADLGEAINSMYMWYKRAAVCFVYLYDVQEGEPIGRSSWFTRGWTLQELIAPTKLHFYDRNWSPIASKHDLSAELEGITGIPQSALHDFRHDHYCTAEKMSWAARRKTTRKEDSAYCLLGLFDVNMPLLYGEGRKAFLRLQEEIMRTSTDLSILLWQGHASPTNGMLAAAPRCFEGMDRSRFEMMRHKTVFNVSEGWDTNNAGISIHLAAYPYLRSSQPESILCVPIHENFGASIIGIFLQTISSHKTSKGIPSYRRITVHGKAWVELDARSLADLGPNQQLFITRQALANHTADIGRCCSILIQTPAYTTLTATAGHGTFADNDRALKHWTIANPVTMFGREDITHRFYVEPLSGTCLFGHVVVTLEHRVKILVCFGCDRNSRAICLVLPFCGQLYTQGLQASNLLAGFDALCSESDQDGDEINRSQACEFFAISSNDNSISSSRELHDRGINIVLNGGVFADLYYASLSFEPEKFSRHYFGSESARSMEGKLADYEQQLDARRREVFKIDD
jgi:hypothetical protein